MIRHKFYPNRAAGASGGKISLPGAYHFYGAKTGQKNVRHPAFHPPELPEQDDSPDYRQRFGKWLTSPENPRFTQVIANRLWKQVMRRGLIEPIDDLRDDSKATHPELLAYLTQLMKDLHYDMQAYLEVLYNTRTYQRCIDPEEPAEGEPYYYRGHLLARMTAEQVWDSLLTLSVPDVDEIESGLNKATVYYEGQPVLVDKADMYAWYDEVKDFTPEQ